ncbi:MAG: pyridoxamine 5'-phosphate oxidase family protein [Acidimicrobiales bacterium]
MGYEKYPVYRTDLSRAACLQLLRNTELARVVSSIRCLPVARPTRISLVGDDHLILTSNDDIITTLAQRGDVLAVQIDGLDLDGVTWSVTVSGIAAPAGPAEQPPPSLLRALSHGAALLALPLNLVTGERVM